MHEYEIIVYWSADDDAFFAEAPELPGCVAHGGCADSAKANCEEAIQLWIDTAKEFGRDVPRPRAGWFLFT